MQLSKTELRTLGQIGRGHKKVADIGKVLKKSKSQIYRICTKLSEEGIISMVKGVIEPMKKTHITLLLQILVEFPNIVNNFSGAGLKIYMSLLEPRTAAEVEKETKVHRATIFKELRAGKNISLVYIERRVYKINEKVWPKVKEFLEELKKYEEIIDNRVPPNAEIYFKNKKEIVFSIREEVDATMTAFSAYKNYGIKIFTITNYYYLPKKALTKSEILQHSLYIAEKNNEIRAIIYSALFYLKYRNECKRVMHPIIKKIKKVLEGEKIKMFPSLKEIKEKAEMYDIQV